MTNWCSALPQFTQGEQVVSIVIHPPEIISGTMATIVSPHLDTLYAVKLPSGEYHRWFTTTELKGVSYNPSFGNSFRYGDMVQIISDQGHPAMIKKGMVVQIAKVIQNVPFYDLRLSDGKYHRWLAEFEVTRPL
jgi:hypothetical protein